MIGTHKEENNLEHLVQIKTTTKRSKGLSANTINSHITV